MKKGAVIINRIWLILGICCILFYLAEGILVRFGQSMLFIWLLAGLVCAARWWLWRRAWRQGREHPFSRGVLICIRVVLVICLAFFLFVESFVVSWAVRKPEAGLDAIIVLGARVNEDGPSGSLRQRIDAAAWYLRDNPDTMAVASGGQGNDEPMSEAECIRRELEARGIAPERILTEDRSTSTAENLANSIALLDGRARRVGVVTNDFHIFRAVCLGRAGCGVTLSPVPARSTLPGFVHYSVREFFALCLQYVRGELAFA